ncbi:MAG: hypothetical protein ACLFO6_03355 [Archaeoglobaceae archaeon]
MCTKTGKGLIFMTLLISLVLAGCSSTTPEIEPSETPDDTVPSDTPVGKEIEKSVTSTPQDQLTLQDSAASLWRGTVDKVFLISHRGQEEFPASDIVIEVYQHGELVDSLTYDRYSKRFQGEKLRSLPFSDGVLENGDDVLITEMSGFNIESDSVLTVKVVQTEEDRILLYEQIRVI